MCWYGEPYGHVAVVEQVHEDGTITISESHYQGTFWNTKTGTASGMYTGSLQLQGFIYLIDSATPVQNHTVTFNADGGAPTPTAQEIADGGKATDPGAPTRAGYAFDGWFAPKATTPFDFNTGITGDLTLTAKWTKLHTVTFDVAGGETAKPADQVIRDGTKAKDPGDPTRDGYEFDGWFEPNATAPFNFDTAPTGDLDLTAKWTKLHTVTFDVAGGDTKAPDTQIVRDNTKAKQPDDPTRENYEFLGWFAPGATEPFDLVNTSVTGDLALTAGWKQVKFCVSGFVWYDDGDGIQGGSGVRGVYVKIMDANGRRLAWTRTDAEGRYALPYFEEGSYTVQFYNIPRGCRIAPSFVGDDPTVDSNGLKQKIYLTEDDPYHDLGLLKQSVRSTRRR